MKKLRLRFDLWECRAGFSLETRELFYGLEGKDFCKCTRMDLQEEKILQKFIEVCRLNHRILMQRKRFLLVRGEKEMGTGSVSKMLPL